MIKTLSIPQELEDFLSENPDLSPSKMLQSKIIEIRENRKLRFSEFEALKKQNKRLQEELIKSGDRIDVLEKNKE